MPITIHIYYAGAIGNARRFAEEMIASGIVDSIRREEGNERYDYFFPMSDPETLLLIDRWKDQQSLDVHHALPLMAQIALLREKYDLHMKVERFVDDTASGNDDPYIRK